MFEQTPPAQYWRRLADLFNKLSTALGPLCGDNMKLVLVLASLKTLILVSLTTGNLPRCFYTTWASPPYRASRTALRKARPVSAENCGRI